MSDGNRRSRKGQIKKTKTTSQTGQIRQKLLPVVQKYTYGDKIIAESGKKSRGGLKSLDELYAPGVELVSGELLSPTFKSKVTIAIDSFTFNSSCVRLFNNTQYVELVFDKKNQRLIVLPSTPIPKESFKFALIKNDLNTPRRINSKKFCALLFHHMKWSANSRYRIMAIYQELDGRELLVFNLDETIEIQSTTIITDDGKKKTAHDYLLPVRFMNGFGCEYSESDVRHQVDLSDMFLFIDPTTGETHSRQIEARIPDSDDIIKNNYRPNLDKEKKRVRTQKSRGDNGEKE
jgi:hypothetical protein